MTLAPRYKRPVKEAAAAAVVACGAAVAVVVAAGTRPIATHRTYPRLSLPLHRLLLHVCRCASFRRRCVTHDHLAEFAPMVWFIGDKSACL